MCILFLIGDGHPPPNGFKLILASNRDEFYARPAAVAAPWEFDASVYGGLDMLPGREGGSWLAIGTRDAIKVGALLNVTGETKHKDCIGRGPIVANYVTSNLTNEEYSQQLIGSEDLYNAFNFVTVDINQNGVKILHCSNSPASIDVCPEGEPMGFGNSPLSNPFEKVKSGRKEFGHIVKNANTGDKEILVQNLMDLLNTDIKYWPDEELKRRAPLYGESLSRICVKLPELQYGSRTRTVILVDENNHMDFYEETMSTPNPNDPWTKTHIARQLKLNQR